MQQFAYCSGPPPQVPYVWLPHPITDLAYMPYHQYHPTAYSQPYFGDMTNGITPSFEQPQKTPEVKCPPQSSEAIRSVRKTIQTKRTVKRDIEYRLKGQNIKRNVFSNIVRHMVCFLRRKKASLSLVERIIDQHELDVTPDDFYTYVNGIHLPNYIKMDIVTGMWFDDQGVQAPIRKDLELKKIMRIASYSFLGNDAHRCILLAKKIRAEIKTDHYVRIRLAMSMLRAQRRN